MDFTIWDGHLERWSTFLELVSSKSVDEKRHTDEKVDGGVMECMYALEVRWHVPASSAAFASG